MANLHELIGQEVERRHDAERQAQANFDAMRRLCEAVLAVKAGQAELDDLDVFVSPTSASWKVRPAAPKATIEAVPDQNAQAGA